MMVQGSLQGKTAIITGAGRGIGRALALVFAEAGADVVVAARTTSEIEATARDVRGLGRQALAVPTDVSNSSDVDALVEQALDHFGKVDILVNNAGQFLKAPLVPLPGVTPQTRPASRGHTSRISDAEWRNIIDANLSSVFYACRAVAPHMLERRYGKIINISSNNAAQAFPWVVAYNASKAALNMVTRVLALEWADYNICVNAIGPGDYATGMSSQDPAAKQRLLEEIPFHRLGDLRELGILAVYLASPASDYMTGQIIYMDGGRTAK